jgi:hypothetical protein
MYTEKSRITFEGLPTPLPLGSFEFVWLEFARTGKQKTYSPPAQVCYFCSLSCACHRYMNVTGQTLLEKKKKRRVI